MAGSSHDQAEEKEGSEAELTWKVWNDPAGLDDFQIVLTDLESSLGPSELEQFKRSFAEFRGKDEESPKVKKLRKI